MHYCNQKLTVKSCLAQNMNISVSDNLNMKCFHPEAGTGSSTGRSRKGTAGWVKYRSNRTAPARPLFPIVTLFHPP